MKARTKNYDIELSLPGLALGAAVFFLVLSSLQLLTARYDASIGSSLLSLGFSALRFSYSSRDQKE